MIFGQVACHTNGTSCVNHRPLSPRWVRAVRQRRHGFHSISRVGWVSQAKCCTWQRAYLLMRPMFPAGTPSIPQAHAQTQARLHNGTSAIRYTAGRGRGILGSTTYSSMYCTCTVCIPDKKHGHKWFFFSRGIPKKIQPLLLPADNQPIACDVCVSPTARKSARGEP